LKPKMKVLVTTVHREAIAPTARFHRREIPTRNSEECFAAANNIEYINSFTLPNYATRFLKANLPSIDVLEYPTLEEYRDALKNRYDAVGISFWTYTSWEAHAMAAMAKEAGVREVWGGGHGTSTPGIAKYFDRVFSGYSEYDLKPLIEGVELTDFEHPVLTSVYDYYNMDIKTGYLFSIRGCRMPCTFCSGPNYYKRLDMTPLDKISSLLDAYRKEGVCHVTVVDETFLQNARHAKDVIRLLREKEMTWTCTSRVDRLVGNIADLRAMGLQNVYIGIESLDGVSLDSVKKGIGALQTVALLAELEKCGVNAFGTYMVCLENDSPESVMENVAKLSAFKALYSLVFWITTPFPGTEFYDEMERDGRLVDKDWKHYDALHLVTRHPRISPHEARSLLEYCIRNHCHELNLRKAKILRKWSRYEKQLARSEVTGQAALNVAYD